jgi:hypothetical protein
MNNFPKKIFEYIVGQLYGVPHGIIRVFNTILYENEFQNPQILMDTLEITKSCLTLIVGQEAGHQIEFYSTHQLCKADKILGSAKITGRSHFVF